jgi:hypothetical protein
MRTRQEVDVEYEYLRHRLKAEHADDFAREWREKVVPRRRRFGIEVIGGWILEDRIAAGANGEGGASAEVDFVWLIAADGLQEKLERYYAQPAHDDEISPTPNRFTVGDHELRRARSAL